MKENETGPIWKSIKKEQLLILFLGGLLLLVIAIPTKETSKSQEEELTTAQQLEQQLETALMAMEGIGQVKSSITLEPLVDGDSSPQIRGVLVIAQSGGDPVAVQKIQESVMTLFQLEAHKIKVMKMK